MVKNQRWFQKDKLFHYTTCNFLTDSTILTVLHIQSIHIKITIFYLVYGALGYEQNLLLKWDYKAEGCEHDLCLTMNFTCNENAENEVKLLNLDQVGSAKCALQVILVFLCRTGTIILSVSSVFKCSEYFRDFLRDLNSVSIVLL